MRRRDFIQLTGLGLGATLMPISLFGNPVPIDFVSDPIDVSIKKKLADVALNATKSLGATYTDVRIGRYLNQAISTREKQVQNISNTESYGIGIRVIVNGTWGFASSNNVNEQQILILAKQAVDIAKANSKLQKEPLKLAPVEAYGEINWATPIKKNAFSVPIAEKLDLLMNVNARAMENGASFVNSRLFFVNEQKYFASSEGSYIDQDIHRLWPDFTVTAVESGKFKTRNALSAPMGLGYEYLDGNQAEKIIGPYGLISYRNSYDMVEDATNAARQAKEKLKAKSVTPGIYDLVLEPNHLGLTIHESVGHPLELDRVMGYEANFAGTSFATLDKWKSGKFQYGSEIVNLFADKTQAGTLNAVGYDDEGVKTKQWDLVKNGILVNYQATRDQVHILNKNASHGCSYAASWNDVQFQRMPNVSLMPGKEKLSANEMIGKVENGIYIVGRGSFSIDQQRYNFQFGGQLFFEIKNGEIIGMLEDVAYQANTLDFWKSCAQICDESEYRFFGSFNDGKGQPMQSSAVSHGSSTTRFNGITVINTARQIN